MKSVKLSGVILSVILANFYTTSMFGETDAVEQIDANKPMDVPDVSIDVDQAGSENVEQPAEKPTDVVAKKESINSPKNKAPANTSSTTPEVKPVASATAVSSEAAPTASPAETVTSLNSVPSEPSQDALASFVAEPGVISDGSRLKHPERGISIVPPVGWKVRSDMPGTTFFLKAPPGPTMSYPRNIGVVRFAGSSYVDEAAAEKMTKFLVENFPTASPSIANYALRNFQKVQTTDKRDAILIYADFEDKGERMMQANVMVSGQDEHFLISYTDRAAHFEDQALSAQFFNEPWAALMSVELTTPSPVPTLERLPIFVAIGVSLLTLIVGVSWFRRRRSQKLYESYANLDANDAPISGSPMSLVGQEMTGDSMIFKKQNGKTSGKKSETMTSSVSKVNQPDQNFDGGDSLDKIQPSSKLDSRFDDELDSKVKNWKLG